MTAKYNIVVIGKTGVGKSSLINYLYGENIRESGVGKPVTEQGFHEIETKINDLPVRIFDSWGLEAGKSDQWKEQLDDELNKRGVDKSAEDWFHSVLYCFGAGGGRIEQFELDIIQKFISENYKVTVVLTKSDLASEADLELLIDILGKNTSQNIAVLPVCSEGKKLLSGATTETFGKDVVINQIQQDFWDAIISRLPERCEREAINHIKNWQFEQKTFVARELSIAEYFNDVVKKQLKENQDNLLYDLEHKIITIEIRNTLEMYDAFSEALKHLQVNESTKKPTYRRFDRDFFISYPMYWNWLRFFSLLQIFAPNKKYYKEIDVFVNNLLKNTPLIKKEVTTKLEEIKEKVIN